MKRYKFYDTDITGREDYDIIGEYYKELIQICCKYCTVFSLKFTDPRTCFMKELEKYRIPIDKNAVIAYAHYYRELSIEYQKEIRFYKITPALCELLLHISDSVFHWSFAYGYHNPEDPVFYRSDGSIFFDSVIHEGYCTLMPREDEDIRSILSKGNWVLLEE